MNEHSRDDVRAGVRKQYGNIARSATARAAHPEAAALARMRASSSGTRPRTSLRSPRGRTWARLWQPAGHCRTEGRRDGSGPGSRRRLRLLSCGEASRTHRASHRSGHDAGHGREGAGERAEARSKERRVSARGDRTPSRRVGDRARAVIPALGRKSWAGLLHHPLPASVFVVGLPDATQPVRPSAITLTSV
jgi:hypothetical protein